MNARARRGLIVAGVLLAAAALFSLKLGSVGLTWGQLINVLFRPGCVEPAEIGPVWRTIVWEIRLPRILLAMGVGAALAMSGAAFQAVLGNPLADPYLLGVSSGASLGAVLIISFIPGNTAWIPPAAFVAAMGAFSVVLALARTKEGLPSDRMILSGVAVGSVLTAVVALLLILSRGRLTEAFFWLMGGFSGRGWPEAKAFLPYFSAGSLVLLAVPRELNLMALGEEAAGNLGIPTGRVKLMILATGSLLAGAAVSVGGVIGFIGLIVPHLARMIVGPDHRGLIPFAGLGGALLLLGADTVVRSAAIGGELPVGIVTAFLGGPFFLWLLRRGSYGG